MDTSKEYILMCEKSVEIQNVWKERVSHHSGGLITNGNMSDPDDWMGYWVATRVFWNEPDFVAYLKCRPPNNKPEKWIWLPRQDQLQEILGNYEFCTKYYYDHIAFNKDTNFRIFRSMEQVWLAFVMKERFKKIWDGEDWKESS